MDQLACPSHSSDSIRNSDHHNAIGDLGRFQSAIHINYRLVFWRCNFNFTSVQQQATLHTRLLAVISHGPYIPDGGSHKELQLEQSLPFRRCHWTKDAHPFLIAQSLKARHSIHKCPAMLHAWRRFVLIFLIDLSLSSISLQNP